MEDAITYAAFAKARLVAQGPLLELLTEAKAFLDRHGLGEPLLIFERQTGRQVDFDFRGTLTEVVQRATPSPAAPTRGRPKLGVVSREVSLLPRHWSWLEAQPSGASAALRRLVDEARKAAPEAERARLARDRTSRFMTSIAGDRPQYEEATRALFASERARFEQLIAKWPKDIRAEILAMSEPAFALQPEV